MFDTEIQDTNYLLDTLGQISEFEDERSLTGQTDDVIRHIKLRSNDFSDYLNFIQLERR